jgi:hypothetical protein
MKGTDMQSPRYRVALLWAGEPTTRHAVKLEETRLARVADALAQRGIDTEPAVYADELVDDMYAQLLRVDGVLVWVDPIVQGRNRTTLDRLLRRVADAGVIVSAHPDVILKMGTKEVLYRTRQMSWGCDTRLYSTPGMLKDELPRCLSEGKPRVLKQYRGNGGNGVWKVEQVSDTQVRVRHAQRGSVEEVVSLDEFLARCEPYFTNEGRMIDQPYQSRLTEGMIRCYLVRDKVAGFGEQLINALFPAPAGGLPTDAPQPGPRLYFPPTRPDFQLLKQQMENEWVPELCSRMDIELASLPVIWDADFLHGPKDAKGKDAYVLCEINVSAVLPFPDEALGALALETLARLELRRSEPPRRE